MISWKTFFEQEKKKNYFIQLKKFIEIERSSKTIYPKKEDVFNAFMSSPISNIKVVIIGQDPYHGEGQAHGLSFSVPKNIKIPPSLKNIYKELKTDLSIQTPTHGNLSCWANQGVLLLNATLTVQATLAGSHQKKGWEEFTNNAIKYVSKNRTNVVFLLWGRFARSKKSLIDQNRHLILEAAHPSPLSAYNGFFGCKHFSRTNKYLEFNKINTINWNCINEKELQKFDIKNINDRDIEKLDILFKSNTPIMFPTDTVWGLHTKYDNLEGIDRIKNLKRRDDSKQFIVITDNLTKIKKLKISKQTIDFINDISSLGAVTFILKLRQDKTIAVRLPQTIWLKELLKNLDYPLVSTSANISKKTIPNEKNELFDIFNNSVHIIDDKIEDLETISSTIIDLSVDNKLSLIREGKIKFKQIEGIWENL